MFWVICLETKSFIFRHFLHIGLGSEVILGLYFICQGFNTIHLAGVIPRAKDFISFMKEKDLITEIDSEDLPKADSYKKTRRFLRITNKGAAFLRGYLELRGMINDC